MEVHLNIPDDLIRYVEYIPAEALPEVIVNILRQDIMGRHKTSVQPTVDLTEVLQLLKQIKNSGIQIQSNPVVENNNTEEELTSVVNIVEEQISALDLEDDDLGDLLDLLK